MNRSGLKLMCFKSEDLKTLSIFFFILHLHLSYPFLSKAVLMQNNTLQRSDGTLLSS